MKTAGRSSSSLVSDAQIETEILACLVRRDSHASSCPSEVARALVPLEGGLWRELMPRVRHVLVRLVLEDRVIVTRGRLVLSAGDFDGGPIRIRRGTRFGVTVV